MMLCPCLRRVWPSRQCSPLPRREGQAGLRTRLSPYGRPHNGGVSDYLSIGDFSRATHMTVKTLRHYHQMGLLKPAEVDACTGYRRYSTDQIRCVQGISRLRELDMRLGEIQGVLSAPDLRPTTQRFAPPVSRLEAELGRTRAALASLRDLLTAPRTG